jgi:hypothetical protein
LAKKKTNKSQLIRDYLSSNPESSAAEIAKALNVQPALVYNVKRNLGMKGKGKRGRPPKSAAKKTQATKMASGSQSSTRNGAAANDFALVLEAARFIQSCGSSERAKEALEAAEEVAAAMR